MPKNLKLSRLLEKKPQPSSQTSKRLVYRIFWMRNLLGEQLDQFSIGGAPLGFLDGPAGIDYLFCNPTHPLHIS